MIIVCVPVLYSSGSNDYVSVTLRRYDSMPSENMETKQDGHIITQRYSGIRVVPKGLLDTIELDGKSAVAYGVARYREAGLMAGYNWRS